MIGVIKSFRRLSMIGKPFEVLQFSIDVYKLFIFRQKKSKPWSEAKEE